jgi:hypothetical protein
MRRWYSRLLSLELIHPEEGEQMCVWRRAPPTRAWTDSSSFALRLRWRRSETVGRCLLSLE